jgi:hypothetical protein
VTTPAEPLDRETLVPGQRYRITLDDCCVEGWFEGVFVEIVRDSEGDPDGLRFDTGVVGPWWSSSWEVHACE